METHYESGSKGPSRRAFLSASAVTAVAAAPIVSVIAPASAASASVRSAKNTGNFDPALRALIRQIDPNRIQATIEKLVSFGTRNTLSSQTDPNRGIGAAYTWVFEQMQGFAAASNGNMTVQQQTFTQTSGLPTPTQLTNTIATLKGTASPERFYVVTRPVVRHPPVPRHHRPRRRDRGGAGAVRLVLHGRADGGGGQRRAGHA